jgi:phage terminase small subunit
MALTPKQEGFCQKYLETGNASEAYRLNYKHDTMKPETINREAKSLLDTPKISARIEELKKRHAKRHDLTVDDLIAELEEARALARDIEQPAAMVSATTGKSKLLGLDKTVIAGDPENPVLKEIKVSFVG